MNITPRGIANSNPGNIRKGDAWRGLAPIQSDPDFCVFQAPIYGIRAIVKILRTYQVRDYTLTIREIINRWAPPSENDTGAYVNDIAAKAGVNPDFVISIGNRNITAKIVKAVIWHENGQQPYSDTLINDAMTLAGIPV